MTRDKKVVESFLDSLYDNVEVIMPVAAAIIIKKDINSDLDQLLLIQRSEKDHWPLYWEIPRGKCDGGNNKPSGKEDLIKCLKREIREEVGLTIDPIRLVDKFSYVADNGKRKSVQYNYLCKVVGRNKQEVKLSNEHQRFKWVTSMSEVQLMVLPELYKSISKVFNVDESIVDYNSGQDNLDIQE